MNQKSRNLGHFNSVTQLMNHCVTEMKAAIKRKDKKRIKIIWKRIHAARIRTKQFNDFYDQQIKMEK